MKSVRKHVVPLSPAALEVLERRREVRTGDNIFASPSGSPVSYTNFALAPAKAGIDTGSAHSWRSIFRDWAGDVDDVKRDIAEAALAHSLGSTEAAYRHGTAVEKRRVIMENYSRWLVGDVGAGVIAFPVRA
jgi:integrase